MAYCESTDVRRLRVPAAPTGGEGDSWDDTFQEHILAADAEIDSRLGVRYAVPFDPVPEQIRQISLTLAAAYFLDPTFSGGGEEKNTELSQHYRGLAEAAIERLLEGTAILPGVTPSTTSTGAPSTVGYHSNLGHRPRLWDVVDLSSPPYRDPNQESSF